MGEENPPSEELAHYGVPGMKWGQRKLQEVTGGGSASQAFPHITAAAHALRKDAGFVATREMLQRFGHLAVPAAKMAGKTAGKGAVKLVKYTPRIARGSATTLRLLGGGAKLLGKGGKAYVKGAISIARMVR